MSNYHFASSIQDSVHKIMMSHVLENHVVLIRQFDFRPFSSSKEATKNIFEESECCFHLV